MELLRDQSDFGMPGQLVFSDGKSMLRTEGGMGLGETRFVNSWGV